MDRLEAMSVFVAVAETGSLSAASRKLRIPLATVSRKLAELEAHLKSQLVMRSSRKVALTEAGGSFFAACRRILYDVEEAERRALGEYKTPKGELVLSAPIALGRLYLLPVVIGFLREYPMVNVRMALSDRRVNLIEDHVDIALRVGDLPDSSLVAIRVGSVRRVVCASPDYINRRGAPMHPRDLIDHECVTFENTISAQAWAFEIDSSERRFPIHSRLIVNTAEAAIDAAAAGVGLTRPLDYQAASHLRSGALMEILVTFAPAARPVNLLFEKAEHVAIKTRTFLDYATPRLRAMLPVKLQ
jgi:DNA-binding transcriptional LysR family regulator